MSMDDSQGNNDIRYNQNAFPTFKAKNTEVKANSGAAIFRKPLPKDDSAE